MNCIEQLVKNHSKPLGLIKKWKTNQNNDRDKLINDQSSFREQHWRAGN